jgi:ABC-type multidrug transport system ATPase subunit
VITATGLTKRYGAATVLRDVTFSVAAGEAVGIDGPSGSGRTTLLRIVATLVRPDAGTLAIDGVDALADPYRIRGRIAYLGTERLPVGGRLDASEYLAMMLAGRAPAQLSIEQALSRAGVPSRADVGTLSDSGRQRLLLTSALLAAPRVLVLDDPLRALDEEWRGHAVSWLQEATGRGSALLAASPRTGDVDMLCGRRIRLEGGRATDTAPVVGVGGLLHAAPERAV